MSPKISRELAEHRLEQAKEEVVACEALYDLKLYKSANNRAYYSIFHSIRANRLDRKSTRLNSSH